ncbi:hypothetical protein [Methanolobus sp. WCC4]|uniref:DUF7507 domain-containing protein n=1 Tax=Methanolobus sp. WCC4 TaxID=3125784 RepID=UPI0030FACF20
MTKYNLIFVIALAMLVISGTAAAISVDGERSTGEWSEDWNFGQVNGSSYDPNGPFGDKMVVFQNGSWYDEDLPADAGTNFNENLSTEGPYPSGYDIKGQYAHYDIINDTLYGMSTVYGLPGDLDGDGNIIGLTENGDILGPVTGKDITGIGPGEQWSIMISQGGKALMIVITNNNWTVSTVGFTGLDENDVVAANSNAAGPDNCSSCVYEISVQNLSQYFNMTPGQGFSVASSAGGNLDIVGEDIAAVFFEIPNPVIDIEKSTNGEDADEAPGPGIPQGNELLWTYVVTNTGNVPLENVSVTDDKLGPITDIITNGNGDSTLDLGETWIYIATGIAECGQYENNATAVGFFDVIPVFDTDPSHYFGECPDIDIEKATNGEDADVGPGPGIPEGDAVTWTYVVTNTGNVPLSNVVVTDDQGVIAVFQGGDTNADGILDLTETWTYEAEGTAECGQYANMGNVTGDSGDITVTDEDPSHYFGECPEIDIEKATNGEDADIGPGLGIPEGDAVIWTYVVTNTGNVPLSNVVVTDNQSVIAVFQSGDTNADGILDLTETWTYEAEGTAECGQYANLGTVTGDYGDVTVTDADPSHYFGECPDIDIEKATNGEDADTGPGPGIPEGDAATWTYVVTNTGNVPLSNVVVTDNQSVIAVFQGGDTNADGILDLTETWTYEAEGTAECGQYANLGTVTGDYGDVTVTDADPSHYFGECPDIDIEKATNGEDADTGPGPGIPEGDAATWTYVVTNTGNVPLSNVVVTDNQSVIAVFQGGDTNADGILDLTETWTYEAEGTAECGQYANLGTVTGDYGDVTVTDADPSHYFGECSGIDIEKATNGEDADTGPGPGIPEGDAVIWTYVVTNTGNVPLSNVVVTDDQGVIAVFQGGDTNADGILDLTETWTYEAEGTAECGQYANLGTVTGDYGDITVTDVDPSHYFGECPDIDIEKATNGEDADTGPGPGIPEGDAVTWTYVVTNTGNVPLSNIVVTDNQSVIAVFQGGDTNADGILDLTETWTYEAEGTAECGQYANLGTVTGDYGDVTVTDADPSHYFGECPDIDIEKATNGEDADSAPGPTLDRGDAVTWTYVIENTGNVDLSNIQVSDNILGTVTTIIDQGDGDDILAVGETWTLEATGTAECGDYANIGTVTGDYGDVTVADEDPSHYNVVCIPRIDIEKSTNGVNADVAPGPTLVYKSDVIWEYVVTNTGNVPLTNVTVTDDQLGIITTITDQGSGDDTLMPGEVWVYQANGTAECGQYENIGDVVGHYGAIPVTDEDPSHYNVECGPDIDIEKYINGNDADQAPGILLAVGDGIIWTFVVENTGNVPLENIVVVDDKLGTISPSSIISKSINNDDILDPGEVWTYELSDSMQECVPQHTNTAVVTGEFEGNEVTDEDAANYYCQPVVPLLSPVGMMVFISSLGLVGSFYLRRRD